jgi:hypothetical protein
MRREKAMINGVPMAGCASVFDDKFMRENFPNSVSKKEQVSVPFEDRRIVEEAHFNILDGTAMKILINGQFALGPIVGNSTISIVKY